MYVLTTSRQSTEGPRVNIGVFVFQKSGYYSVLLVFYIWYILKNGKKIVLICLFGEKRFSLFIFFLKNFFNLSLLISKKKSVLGKEALKFSSVLRD